MAKSDNLTAPKSSGTNVKGKMRNTGYQPHTRSMVFLEEQTSNDISYYNKNRENFDKAVAVPFVETLGNTITWNSVVRSQLHPTVDGTIPSVMTIDVMTGPGWAAYSTDAVNVAITQIMADIYAKTSSSTIPFAQADLALFIQSMQSIVGLIAVAKRALAARNFWVDRNLYWPRGVLQALDFDYQDINSNYPLYASILNETIDMFNNIEVLDFVDVYKRQYSLFRNLYVDEDSPMGQIYAFKPYNYYEYDDINSKCVWHAVSTIITPLAPFSSFLTLIRSLILRWYGSQDLYYINGYLKRAYKDTASFKISRVDGSEDCTPVVDDVMMMQLMNATIWRASMFDQTTLDVTQDPVSGLLLWQPKSTAVSNMTESVAVGSGTLLRVYKAEPTGDDVMEMTRFVNIPALVETNKYLFRECGPEIVVGVNIHRFDFTTNTSSTTAITKNVYAWSPNGNGDYEITASDLNAFCQLQAFRYTPLVFYMDHSTHAVLGLAGDLYNYTTLSYPAWRNLQRVAMFSLYKAVPI